MKTRARAALSVASIVLVAGGAAGCGGGDDSKASSSASATTSSTSSTSSSTASSDSAGGAGTGTSQADFCGAFDTFEKDLAGVDPTSEAATIVSTFKAEAKKLEDAGTPTNIPTDADSGFKAVLNAIDSLPADASLQDLSNLDSSLSATDKKNGQAFETYLATECPELGASASASASTATSPSAG